MRSIFFLRKALAVLILSGGGSLLFQAPANAQNINCSGTVIDESGQPVIGAAVVEQGSNTNGVISDIDGSFSISVPDGSLLEVSCIGYQTQTAQPGPDITIVLRTDAEMLEGAVSVGYGTMKKEDITGAMVSVTSEDLVQLPVNNAIEALQGKAAGVVISTAGVRPGEVGSISVRGSNSINADQSPLVVIDGIVGQSVGLDMLNPQDIESIEILKDASATAIYGARAGNGVILVNTKKGKEGRFTLNYSGTVTLEKIYDRVPMMNAQDYIEWRRWGYYYAGLGPSANEPSIVSDRALFTSYGADETAWGNILRGWGLTWDEWNAMSDSELAAFNGTWDGSRVISTDWTQFTDRIGITQEHSISASGGTDKMNAYVSFGYLDQNGTNIGQDFTRYTLRASVDINPVSWFKMGGSMNGRVADQEYGIDASGGISGNIPSSLHDKARNIFSYALPYDADGNRITYPGGDTTIPTVVDEVGKSVYSRLNYNLSANIYADINFGELWSPLKGLSFRTTFGPQFSLAQNYRYMSADCVNRVSQGQDYVSSNATKRFSWLLDNMITYVRDFDDHSLNVTLLQEASSYLSTQMYNMSGVGVALGMTQKWWGLDPDSVTTLNSPSYNSLTESTLASYMARVNYSYKGKYSITASFRYDGASQLGEGHKWAGFPSLAVAWNMHEEEFMKGIGWLDQLKLRAGWGKTGNYSVDIYSTKNVLETGRVVHGSEGTTEYYTPTDLANNAIGWETTTQYNIGLDFSVLKGRISGVLDLYQNYTDGLIFAVTLPSVSGYDGTDDNVGRTSNYGFDLTLNSVNISNRNFSWNSTVNLSFNDNRILELQSGKQDMVSDNLFIGGPINVLFGYESAGLWTDSAEDLAEIAKFNANGHNFAPGMVRPVDQNGDYKIDSNYDRVILGNTVPKWNLGFNNVLRWKNLELSIFIYGAFDFIAQTGQYQGGREPVIAMNYYNENNKVGAEYQRPYFNTAGGDSYSGILLQKDASFLKVRQISIGYSLPQKWVKSIGLSNVKFTAQLKNPFSIYQGTSWMDSDYYQARTKNNNSSHAGSSYLKGLVFGVNIGF